LEINAFFEKFKPKLAKLHQLSLEHHIPIAALCLNFALLTEDINKVVIGVDSKANLEEHVGSAEYLAQTRVLLPELQALAESNEQFILPVNWKF
jgi:aryl-alcohol dehydrogenase-like predicted oxidoreductase